MNVLSEPSRKISAARRADKGETAGDTIRGRFRASSRLLRHGDFQRVYKLGRRHFGTHLTAFYVAQASRLQRGTQGPRIGFTVSRALGGAVERNRIKRRMREAVRANLASLMAPVDVVINPKKSALTVEFAMLRDEVAKAFAVIQQKETKTSAQT